MSRPASDLELWFATNTRGIARSPAEAHALAVRDLRHATMAERHDRRCPEQCPVDPCEYEERGP